MARNQGIYMAFDPCQCKQHPRSVDFRVSLDKLCLGEGHRPHQARLHLGGPEHLVHVQIDPVHAIATVALAALLVSSSNLISIAESGKMGRDWRGDNLGMKKSSIGGKQYLDYL